MEGWKRSGRGARARLVATLDPQEAGVLRGLVEEIRRLLTGRTEQYPADELAELTGMPTGPSDRPDDQVLARLLPDFCREDVELSAMLRSLHEPALIEAKQEAVAVVLATLPDCGGRVELTSGEADSWLAALNDVRLALGTTLEVGEELPDEVADDDPRAQHLSVYQWLTFVQDALVQGRMQMR